MAVGLRFLFYALLLCAERGGEADIFYGGRPTLSLSLPHMKERFCVPIAWKRIPAVLRQRPSLYESDSKSKQRRQPRCVIALPSGVAGNKVKVPKSLRGASDRERDGSASLDGETKPFPLLRNFPSGGRRRAITRGDMKPGL